MDLLKLEILLSRKKGCSIESFVAIVIEHTHTYMQVKFTYSSLIIILFIPLASPTRMVPFAEFDGKVLASSQAISAYVAKQYGKYFIVTDVYIKSNTSNKMLTTPKVYTICSVGFLLCVLLHRVVSV